MVYHRLIWCYLFVFACGVLRGGVLDKKGFKIAQDYFLSGHYNSAMATGVDRKFAADWIDEHYSQYDIYGRLSQYSPPPLFALPPEIDFSKDGYNRPKDSVVIRPIQAELGGQFKAPLYLHNHNLVNSGVLKFSYDISLLTIDSIGAPAIPGIIHNTTSSISDRAGIFTVVIPTSPDKGLIAPGFYHLGDIYGRANDSLTGTVKFEAAAEPNSFYLEYRDTGRWAPVLSGGIEISIPSADNSSDPAAVPRTLFLKQNVPNPFNSGTSISFGLPRPGPVRLEIYNILGQRIISLIDRFLSAGYYNISWNGKDSEGRDMASGIYFYRLNTAEQVAVRKMVCLK